MLSIIDYGMGNLHSVQKAVSRIGVDSNIAVSPNDITNATKLILPGVGHFKNGMVRLKQLGFIDILYKKVIEDRIPILGICLGMQLFTKYSEEGDVEGLGWVDAQTINFKKATESSKLKIPHMGWNNLNLKKQSNVLSGITDNDSFYFVHSYFVSCKNEADILTTTVYGNEFVSSFQKKNITGVQFHPEKSHSAGLKIISNFCKSI